MSKQTGLLVGLFFFLALITTFVFSMGLLDFKPGQGGTAWLAFIFGATGAGIAYAKADDDTIKWLSVVFNLAPPVIALAVFYSH